MSDISAVRSSFNLGALVATPFRAVVHLLMILHVARQRAALVEELYNLTDEELASLGLSRDRIPQYIFEAVADA